ncbi:hypothetical protein STANM309S_03347 [Streptomyces tanashiensis]
MKRILPGESSDSKARSPLAGTGIREGAVLTHVDGRPVDPVAGPYPLLSGTGGTTVELTFTPAEGEGRARRVAVVPLVDERPLRYQDWVAERRAVVREISGGRCGYLHVPDLGGSGWAQVDRDLRMARSGGRPSSSTCAATPAATSFSCSGSRPTSAIFAPRAESLRARSSPTPRAPPVTTATCPSRLTLLMPASPSPAPRTSRPGT